MGNRRMKNRRRALACWLSFQLMLCMPGMPACAETRDLCPEAPEEEAVFPEEMQADCPEEEAPFSGGMVFVFELNPENGEPGADNPDRAEETVPAETAERIDPVQSPEEALFSGAEAEAAVTEPLAEQAAAEEALLSEAAAETAVTEPLAEQAAAEEEMAAEEANRADPEAPEEWAMETEPLSAAEELLSDGNPEDGEEPEDETPGDGEPEDSTESPVIYGLSVKPLETNERYSSLSFYFESEGKEYRCFVTGLETGGDTEPADYEKLAREIAGSFLSGERFVLSGETSQEEYGLALDLIDAEKKWQNDTRDRNICWAASAADMLELTGWNTGENEDEAFSDFRENFSDLGGYQAAGISWYLNGVNTEQYITVSGNIAYREMTSGAAQQLKPGTGGYWKDYAAGEVAQSVSAYENAEDLLLSAAEKLEEGYGVGLGTYLYQNGTYLKSGHALSVFGHILQVIDQAVDRIRGLFISDSDNSAFQPEGEAEERPDTYTLYRTAPAGSGENAPLQLENYSDAGRQTVIGSVTTLEPLASAAEKKETEGTGDAGSTPNLIPESLQVLDPEGMKLPETEAGTAFTLETELANRSYAGLPEDAVIQYMITVYRDGVPVETLEYDVASEGIRPNRSVSGRAEVTLEEEGEYTFGVEILGIYGGDGGKLPEAYTRDNRYQRLSEKLRVVPRSGEEQPADGQPDGSGDSGENPAEDEPTPDMPAETERPAEDRPAETEQPADGPAELSGEEVSADRTPEADRRQPAGSRSRAAKIYELTVVLATDTEYRLDFEAKASSPADFRMLRNRDTGTEVEREAYAVTAGETGFSITFTDGFIRSLRPGRNSFILYGVNEQILIRILIL